jgi:hypothetical protein
MTQSQESEQAARERRDRARQRAARLLAKLRWENTTAEQRSQFMSGVAAQRSPSRWERRGGIPVSRVARAAR